MALDIIVFSGALILSGCLNEFFAQGRKLQSWAGKAFCSHLLVGCAVVAYLVAVRQGAVISFLIAWSGAFLSWFVIRSHLESSILLRMLILLRTANLPADGVVHKYQSFYGSGQRARELMQANLIVRSGEECRLTRKGKLVLKVAGLLGRTNRRELQPVP